MEIHRYVIECRRVPGGDWKRMHGVYVVSAATMARMLARYNQHGSYEYRAIPAPAQEKSA